MDKDSLIDFVEETTGERHFRVEEDFGNGFVRLESSEAERRQAKQDIRCIEDAVIEMLRNSRDAGAHLMFLATSKSGNTRNITLIDDGQGIPESLHELVFEPRITSKLDSFHADRWGVHGRGMALYSIKANTEAAFVCDSAPGKGTSLRVISNTDVLPEKTDQSCIPLLVEDEGRTVFRGPKNINRTVAEFSLDERKNSLVFAGSSIEIASTLFAMGSKIYSEKERIFHKDLSEYPLYVRPAFASDPAELSQICADLGLELSERSARRVMDGKIEPLTPFIQVLIAAQKPKKTRSKSGSGEHRAFGLTDEDKEFLASSMKDAFSRVASGYYLSEHVEPEISVRNGQLIIKIPLTPALGE